jgi:hypothetical protein
MEYEQAAASYTAIVHSLVITKKVYSENTVEASTNGLQHITRKLHGATISNTLHNPNKHCMAGTPHALSLAYHHDHSAIILAALLDACLPGR